MATLSPFTTTGTASTVLDLSKRAWKLGISLSKLEQDVDVVDPTLKILTEEVKALGIECDLVYEEVDQVSGKDDSGLSSLSNALDSLWEGFELQVEEMTRTMQELELFMNSVRGDDSRLIGQAQRQRKMNGRKNQIAGIRTKVCRHTDNLRTTLLLINT